MITLVVFLFGGTMLLVGVILGAMGFLAIAWLLIPPKQDDSLS
jgi:hypothetical protein